MSHPPVVVGIDFGGTKIAVAVCDLAGNKLAAAVVDNGGDRGAKAAFDHGIQTARDLLIGCSAEDSLAAVGVATFGIPFEDRVELAPSIDGWGSLPIGRELRAAFPGASIRMATDAKAAAQAEARWGSLAGFEPAVYLNLGTGLAAAVVIGGTVLAGSHGAAGEIGYNLRSRDDVGLPTGERIPLEEMVSGLALRRRATALGRELTAAEVFAGGSQDAALAEVITDFVEELAFHLVNLAILVNPARIAVGGGMTRSWDKIGPGLAEALSRGVPYPPELVLADFPHEAPLLGAVALAIDAVPDSAGPGQAGTQRNLNSTSTADTRYRVGTRYPGGIDDAEGADHLRIDSSTSVGASADADVPISASTAADAFRTDPIAGATSSGTRSMHAASLNGHYSTNRTYSAPSRPQGSFPAGEAPQAISHSGARFGDAASTAGPGGQNSASKG
ncbi:MAG: ROK family protein [Streptosporangiaceae bacterium]